MRIAMRTLYKEGGVRRFYRGIGPALLQGPLARGGDAAANEGMLSLLNSLDASRPWPVELKTTFAAFAAGAFRIVIMPIDATKTMLQAHGADGFKMLVRKVKANGPSVLWHGALGTAAATVTGYSWFVAWNRLQETVPKPEGTVLLLARNAGIGALSSCISDTISNSLRVTKVYKQTAPEPVSYPNAVREIIAKDGIKGLFGRGLTTRLTANSIQGAVFGVGWKLLQKMYDKENKL